MPTPEQLKRFAADWNTAKEVAGKKVDSIQFAGDVGKERVIVRMQDGTRLIVEAHGGAIRAWVSCCGKPDGAPCQIQ